MDFGGHHDYTASAMDNQYPDSNNDTDHDIAEEMPFAVDLPAPTSGDGSTDAGTPSNSTSLQQSVFGASSSVASFAQKLRTAPQQQRLQFFDSQHQKKAAAAASISALSETQGEVSQQLQQRDDHNNDDQQQQLGSGSSSITDNDDALNRLADQLAEFRSFGASLHISTTSATASAAAASATASTSS